MTQDEATRLFYKHIWPHRAQVLRTARFLARNVADADDLAQETLTRAFRKMEQFDVSTHPQAWLMRILRNIRIDQTRIRANSILQDAQSLESVDLKAMPIEPGCDPQDLEALMDQFSDQVFIDALHSLPEEIRWTLLLVDVQQMSYEDVAQVVDLPEGTVKSRIHRGRRMIREWLVEASADMPESPTVWRNDHAR